MIIISSSNEISSAQSTIPLGHWRQPHRSWRGEKQHHHLHHHHECRHHHQHHQHHRHHHQPTELEFITCWIIFRVATTLIINIISILISFVNTTFIVATAHKLNHFCLHNQILCDHRIPKTQVLLMTNITRAYSGDYMCRFDDHCHDSKKNLP